MLNEHPRRLCPSGKVSSPWGVTLASTTSAVQNVFRHGVALGMAALTAVLYSVEPSVCLGGSAEETAFNTNEVTMTPLLHEDSLTTMTRKPVEVWSAIEDGHRITLEIADDHWLRLRVAAEGEHQKDISYAVVRRTWPKVAYRLTQERGHVLIHTTALDITLQSHPFSMRVADANGRTLFKTSKPALRFENGITLGRKMGKYEAVYGMGEVGELFDRVGGRYVLYNTDDFSRNVRQNFYCQIPFAIHFDRRTSRAYGLFIDNPARQTWDLGFTKPSVATYQVHTGDLELWLSFSGSIGDTLRDWTVLTGQMERPPLWALGNHQSRWSYPTEKRVREIAAEFRQRKIPCDALYLDIDYMDGYRVFTWHPTNFPQPEKLLNDLHHQGFRVVTIVDPGVKLDPNYSVYREFVESDGFFCMDPATSQPYTGRVWPGETHFPDFTRKEVRERWGILQNEALLKKGVDGIWNDMDEPHTFDSKEFPGHVLQYDFGRMRPHSAVHQIYGMTMAQASYEGFRRARPNERPFIITRSGWAGVQRYALMWTGDNQSTWASMILDLQLNLSMGLSGIAFVGCDIGGFAFDCTPELYARWIEWGVFQPFCRTHSAKGTRSQEPWSFGADVEQVARRMIELRMQLLPYLYTAFVEASETGAPVNRPLVYEYPADTNSHATSDEFLVGNAILVAPILTSGADRRMVYFPHGEWYHLWTDTVYSGPNYHIVPAPIGSPAVFIKAGSVIPSQTPQQYVGEKQITETFLDIYPGDTIRGLLVEDDGVTREYLRGVERRTVFEGKRQDHELRLTIKPTKTTYRSPRKSWRIRVHAMPGVPREVVVDNARIATKHSRGITEFSVPDTGQTTMIRVRY